MLNAPIVKNINALRTYVNANAPKISFQYNVVIRPPIIIIPADIASNLANSPAFNFASFIPLVAMLNAPIVKNINALRTTVNPSISKKCANTNPPTNAPINNTPEAATIISARVFKLSTTPFSKGFNSFNLPTIAESKDISLSIANAPKYARGIVIPTTDNTILISMKCLTKVSDFKVFFSTLLSIVFIPFNCLITLLSKGISFSIPDAPKYARGTVIPIAANQILTSKIDLIALFKDSILFVSLIPSILFTCAAKFFNTSILPEISISLEDINASIFKYINDDIKTLKPSFKFSILFISIDSIELISDKALFIIFAYSPTFLLDS